jgi:hypothetical protein
MNLHTPKWIPILEVGVPNGLSNLQKVIARVDPSFWRIFYIIEKLLKRKCLKWGRITHLDISNRSYDKKKGWESNWQLDEGNNFVLDLIVIRHLHAKLWAPKIEGIPTMGILRLPLRSPETKCHSDVAPVERRKEYYKREGGGFPQVRAMVSLVSPRLLVACPSTKNAQIMH